VFFEGDISKRYEILRGIPREIYVVKEYWESRDGGKNRINSAIARLEAGELTTALSPTSNSQITSQLVHQFSEPSFHEESAVNASEYVRTEIYKRFLYDKKFKLRNWLQCTKGIIGGNERGPKFEWFAHLVLGKLKKERP